MEVELLFCDGWPGSEGARRSLEEALDLENLRAEVGQIPVGNDGEEQRPRCPKSPTIRVDGRVLFPQEDRMDWGAKV